jgi:uncharacterized protein YbaR (Trm112 family)
VHIELTEMLRCPEQHAENVLVLSTGEMLGRMVRSGMLGCPVCHREYPIIRGVARFTGGGVTSAAPAPRSPPPVEAQTLQALLDLGGPGGYVVLLGSAARHGVGLAGLMGGIHFVGVNAPPDVEELPVLSLLACDTMVPLRHAMARGVVVGAEGVGGAGGAGWLADAARILLRGRRVVVEREDVSGVPGVTRLAAGQGLFVGERG